MSNYIRRHGHQFHVDGTPILEQVAAFYHYSQWYGRWYGGVGWAIRVV